MPAACPIDVSAELLDRSYALTLPAVPAVGAAVEVGAGVWGRVLAVAMPLSGPVRVLCEPGSAPPPPPPPP